MDIVSYHLENEAQFWAELDDILSNTPHSSSSVTRLVNQFLNFCQCYLEQYLTTDESLIKCIYKFLNSNVFQKNSGRIRRDLIRIFVHTYVCIQKDLLIIFTLLLDGQSNSAVYEMMSEENAEVKVIDIIWEHKDDDPRLFRMCLEVWYEMCRIQRMDKEILESIDIKFVEYLFWLIENNIEYNGKDEHDTPIVKALLVLNEQYMISNSPRPTPPIPSSIKNKLFHLNKKSSSSSLSKPPPPPPPRCRKKPIENKVMTIISNKGEIYPAFGENVIYMLNRERDTCTQLLILKLCYIIFTTRESVDYFYTNDLRVVVDVFIRELWDLPEDAETLRNTYLRVLYPVLSYTQMRFENYKVEELVRLVRHLLREDNLNCTLPPVPDTTLRLVERITEVPWLADSFSLVSANLNSNVGNTIQDDQDKTSGTSPVKVVVDNTCARETPCFQISSNDRERLHPYQSQASSESSLSFNSVANVSTFTPNTKS